MLACYCGCCSRNFCFFCSILLAMEIEETSSRVMLKKALKSQAYVLDHPPPSLVYIWYSHCTHKDASNRQFDPKKCTIVASCLSIMAGCFCWLLFYFWFFFFFLNLTSCNFCNLLFTIEGGKVSCFNLYFDCSGGGG
jgi:hypothetical protein